MQGVHVVLERGPRDGHAQVLEGRAQQLGRAQGRVEHEGGGGARVQTAEEVAGEGGLAGPDLAGDEHEGLAVLDPEPQMGERFHVLGAREDEPGLVAGRERVLVQAEMALKHRGSTRGARPGGG